MNITLTIQQMLVIALWAISLIAEGILHGQDKPPAKYNFFSVLISITISFLFFRWIGFF